MSARRGPRPGFNLIESLVLLALLLFLLGLAMPAVLLARQGEEHQRCKNNLKELGYAAHNCNDVHKRLPPAVGSWLDKQGSVFFFLLPFLEQPQDQGKDRIGPSAPLAVFHCPLDTTAPPDRQFKKTLGTSSYAANWLIFGDGALPASIPAS